MSYDANNAAANYQAQLAATRREYTDAIRAVTVVCTAAPIDAAERQALESAIRAALPAAAEGRLGRVSALSNADELATARDVVTQVLEAAAGSTNLYRCEVDINGHMVRSYHPFWAA